MQQFCLCNVTFLLFKVTADIHIFQATSAQIFISIFSIGGFLRTILGPMPFWVTAAWVESMRWALSFFFALTNISSFLQIALVTDIRYKEGGWNQYLLFIDVCFSYLKKMDDQKVIKLSMIASALQLLPIFIENIQVTFLHIVIHLYISSFR